MNKYVTCIAVLAILLTGCTAPASENSAPNPGGMGAGMGGGMMARHHAEIPEEYAGIINPVAADEESIARGAEIYSTHCASCHGDGGMGDGPAGAALNPAPAAIAHTSQMLSDDHLFWRISEGGGTFSSVMPAWKGVLNENGRWDVINYVRAMGSGKVKPASDLGGATFDEGVQATQQAEMLAQAVEQEVITQAEAETFDTVHTALEQYLANHPEIVKRGGNATEREMTILADLVKDGTITQQQGEAFWDIHDRLGAAGLMP